MIDLDELRAVLTAADDFFCQYDAWGQPGIWRRGHTGQAFVVAELDDRHGDQRLVMWAFQHLAEVLDELEQLQALREVVSA